MKKNIAFLLLPCSLLTAPMTAQSGIGALIFSGMSTFFGLWMMFVFSIMVLNIFLMAFWIWMIIDVAKRNFAKSDDKTLWILIVVLANWIGAVIYYFTIRAKDKNK